MSIPSFDNPYLTLRRPTMAKNVVSTSQPLASVAGLSALAAGGNAVDAALTTAITLTVVEPISNGAGSDAFALTTRAVKSGDGYQLTGHKLWITNGNEADLFIVFANLNPMELN